MDTIFVICISPLSVSRADRMIMARDSCTTPKPPYFRSPSGSPLSLGDIRDRAFPRVTPRVSCLPPRAFKLIRGAPAATAPHVASLLSPLLLCFFFLFFSFSSSPEDLPRLQRSRGSSRSPIDEIVSRTWSSQSVG